MNEIENPAIVQAGQTVRVSPRRGVYYKEPWKSLDLTAITEQTIEAGHVFDVHLGETLVPYAMLEPLKAVLPLKREDAQFPTDPDGVGGIRLGGLERRMRERWRVVSGCWDDSKAHANSLNLLQRLDYHRGFLVQLQWRGNMGSRPVRIVYGGSGEPTAAILSDNEAIVDYTLFWVTCKDLVEANYLLAIINSGTLYEQVMPLMAKGQFGARHLQKHLWKLPIPEFDSSVSLHVEISEAGEAAAKGAAERGGAAAGGAGEGYSDGGASGD